MLLAVGLRGSVRAVVTKSDTAVALGSGDVPVLGTPRLLALAEAATVAAVMPQLGPGETTVGTSVTLEHCRASPVGAGLVVEAELTKVDGRRLVFSFIARREDVPGEPPGEEPSGAVPPADQPAKGRPARGRPAGGRPAGGRPAGGRDQALAPDEHVVGAGTIERVVVTTERFLARAGN